MSQVCPLVGMLIDPYRPGSAAASDVAEEFRTVTPIHASPFSTRRVPIIPHAASESPEPLVLNGSTITRPLKSAGRDGPRTTMRVLYGSTCWVAFAGPVAGPE